MTTKRGLLLTTGLIAALARPALAQSVAAPQASDQTAPGASAQVEEIIVTAQKRSQSLSDVGLTVNVVGAGQLARQGVNNVADLAKSVPGFTAAAANDGAPIYTLRGVSFNSLNFATSPTVSVYIDEAPVPFSVMAQGPLLDLEHVEVLKGPQGTLFGQNATGGAINYIAAKPTSDLSAGARATYARFDTFEGEAFISGPLAPTLNARLAVGGVSSGPWQKSATRDDELGDQRKAAARLLLDWRPLPTLRVSANLNGWVDHSDIPAPQLVVLRPSVPSQAAPDLALAPITATSARSADWDADKRYRRDSDFRQGVVRIDYDLGQTTTLTSLTAFSRVNLRGLSEYDATNLPLQSNLTSGYVQAASEELRLTGALADHGIHYIVGANYQGDDSYESDLVLMPLLSAGRNVAGISSFSSLDVVGRQSNKAYGLFGNLDWDVTEKLGLSGGLRKAWIDHKSQGCTYDTGAGDLAAVINVLSFVVRGSAGLAPAAAIAPGGCATLDQSFAPSNAPMAFSEKNLSWRGNVNYKLGRNVLFYGTVSRGFKAGNYPVASAASTTSLQPVRQEKLTAYEAGAKLRLLDRSLSINGAAYYYDYRDKQLLTNTIDPVFGLLFAVVNIPKSTVRGFDLDATWVPTSNLTLRSAVTYADTRVGTFDGFDAFGHPVSLTGHPFNLAPKWISVSDAEYRHGVGASLEGFVGASVVHNSKTYSDLADSPSLVIRAFTTVDLRAGVSAVGGRWEAMVFGRNVTNTYHWTYAQPGGDAILRYAAQPTTYGVTVNYKF